MIISSYNPTYTFTSTREEKRSYHKFSLRKTFEFSILWYLYIRNFLGENEDILLIDQNADYPIEDFLNKINENCDISSNLNYEFDLRTKLHIKKFKDKAYPLKGIKRLYQYMFRFCYHNNLDFFYIENDCLIAKNFVKISEGYDFVTNTINLHERVCDTYINFIKISRLREHDSFMNFIDYLDLLNKYDENLSLLEEKDFDPSLDVVYSLTNERGIYIKYCYGNVLCLNWDGIYHQGSNEELIQFLEKNPINHPFYEYFLENGKKIINEIQNQ
jgi:hypothetical protein